MPADFYPYARTCTHKISGELSGVVEGWWAGNHHRIVALYDYEKCVQILVNDVMDELEALEFMEVNVTGAFVGEGTPAFGTIYRQPEIASLDW